VKCKQYVITVEFRILIQLARMVLEASLVVDNNEMNVMINAFLGSSSPSSNLACALSNYLTFVTLIHIPLKNVPPQRRDQSSSISAALLCAIHSARFNSSVPPISVGSISLRIPYPLRTLIISLSGTLCMLVRDRCQGLNSACRIECTTRRMICGVQQM